jgi:hypothetical protein
VVSETTKTLNSDGEVIATVEERMSAAYRLVAIPWDRPPPVIILSLTQVMNRTNISLNL